MSLKNLMHDIAANSPSLSETLQHVAQSPKTAMIAAGATGTVGVLDWIDYIPDNIGKVAALMGVILTAVLIRFHYRRGNVEEIERQIKQMELDELRRKEAERKAAALERKEAGLPVRREDDLNAC